MTNGLPFSILVVEDDEDDRIMINEAFGEIGYENEVKKFTNGKALLQYLEQVDAGLYPSLIVLDNTLPELDAIDLLKLLKNDPAYKAIPIIVYTTLLTPSKKDQLLSAGAYACFEKGSTHQEIIQVVKELKAVAESGPKE